MKISDFISNLYMDKHEYTEKYNLKIGIVVFIKSLQHAISNKCYRQTTKISKIRLEISFIVIALYRKELLSSPIEWQYLVSKFFTYLV